MHNNRFFIAGVIIGSVVLVSLPGRLTATELQGRVYGAKGQPIGRVQITTQLAEQLLTTTSDAQGDFALQLSEPVPAELEVMTQDETGKILALDKLFAIYNGIDESDPDSAGLSDHGPDAHGFYTIPVPLRSTMARSQAGEAEPSTGLVPQLPAGWDESTCDEGPYRYQRVTIENLTTGLSRKIFQKMMILHSAPEFGKHGTSIRAVSAHGDLDRVYWT
jgi:hypothetical protein